MKLNLLFLLLLSFFLKINTSYSQIQISDTVAINYYNKYQVDEDSKIKNGAFEMIYKGKTLAKGNYKNGNRDGVWEFSGMNDTLQQKGSFVNGFKEGLWESYYSDGKLSCTMNFKNGKKNGIFKGLFKNGNPSFETKYVNDSIQGLSTYYYESGKISETQNYKGDSLNGISKRFYENGNLKEQKYRRGPLRDSSYYFYYEDGTLWENIIYKNGSPYNVIASNTSDGKPIDCCTLKDGNGQMRFYDKDGKISEEINYKDSQKNGFAKFSRKGSVYEEGNFLNGKNDGVWMFYYPTGEQNSKINYKNGEMDGEGIYYFKDGTVSQKGQFVIGEKSGMWMAYDEKGAIASELNYNSNKLDGDARYYEKGNLITSGKYNKGVRIFVWKFYNAKGKETSVYDYGYTFVSNKDNPPQPPSVNDVVKVSESPLSIVDIMPVFPGGENMMMEFIQKNIVYPQKEKESAIQGIVYVSFVVDNLGEISNVKILRGVPGGAGCDQEAKRIVEIMPRWTPGMQNGRPVPVSFNLPIKYKIR